MLPKVSAVVPVFNAGLTLKRAVDSLLIQPEINQIILVEDGSSDNSLSLCEELARNHDLITLLRHPQGENKGAPASRNLGLNYVINPWIQFMDADDELLPGKIASQLSCIKGKESLIIGPYTLLNETQQVIPVMQDPWAGLIRMRLGISASNLWHTESVRAAGAWNESLLNVQEYHLMFEMLKRTNSLAFSNQNLTLIYQLPNSITRSTHRLDEKRDTYFRFRSMVRDYLMEKGMFTRQRWHHFTICMGDMMRYHTPSFPVSYSKWYYQLIYRVKQLRLLFMSLKNKIKNEKKEEVSPIQIQF